MSVGAMVIFILMALIAVGSLGYMIFKMVKTIRHPMPKTIDFKKEVKLTLILGIANVISFTIMMGVIYPWANINPKAGEVVQAVIGSLFTSISFFAFIYCFFTHYYAKEIPTKLNKWLFIITIASVPTCLVFFFLMTNGYADYLTYPLVNGISFNQGITTPFTGKPSIAWYALCILSGALLAYVVADHRFYLQYGKHGILESTLLVGLPSGIIGARIGYVIGEWNTKFAARVAAGEWWSIFAIWEGGLTIISGAIAAIGVGIIWFITRKKQYSVWIGIDVIVPVILIGQALGRWGNFFNCEVHGVAVATEQFSWLPKIILNNMHYSEYNQRVLDASQVYVPLFLIESIFNMIGYFVIAWGFGKVFKRYMEFGDLGILYIIWYGYTRVFMEPLRDTPYNMGSDGYWSWFWSIMFVLIGSLLIAVNHFVRFLLRQRKQGYTRKTINLNKGIISASIISVLGLSLLIPGIVMMATNTFVKQIGINNFNVGIILAVSGFSILLFISTSILYIVDGLKAKKEYVQEV